MSFDVTCPQLLTVIAVLWIVIRAAVNIKYKKFSPGREALLLLVLFCIAVVARIVYFPWHLENGHVLPMRFDSSQILPLQFNLIPVIHLFDVYDGWKLNLFGNAAMFIPVGIVWPACFKKLNNIGKTVLAGAGFSLCIEISQLFFYERHSDIDDVILNTTGALIGALIFFGVRAVVSGIRSRKKV